MILAIGTTNPAKITAVKLACEEKLPEAKVFGFDVVSGVSDQPLSDEETRHGARNRAVAAMQQARAAHASGEVSLAIGLEGGVFPFEGRLWSTVWVCVVDAQGNRYEANGARFPLPQRVSDLLLQGQELGPLMHALTGEVDVRKKQGAFGVFTKGFVDRSQAYTAITKLAIGQWYGLDWDQGLPNER